MGIGAILHATLDKKGIDEPVSFSIGLFGGPAAFLTGMVGGIVMFIRGLVIG